MRAEDSLQIMADFFSDIFPTRRHALNHLFCVIGNGYEWRDGELVEVVENEVVSRYALLEHIDKAEFRFESLKQTIIEREEPKRRELAEILEQERNSVDAAVKKELLSRYLAMSRGMAFKWYPLCRHSLLYHVPADVKPDWLALVNETKALLEQDGVRWQDFETK